MIGRRIFIMMAIMGAQNMLMMLMLMKPERWQLFFLVWIALSVAFWLQFRKADRGV